MYFFEYYEHVYIGFCRKDEKILEALLSKENKKFSINSLLHTAVKRNHLYFLKFLLEHGADFNTVNCGMSLIEFAIKNRDLEIVKCILNHGADINVLTTVDIMNDFVTCKLKSYTNYTLLHTAVTVGSIEIIELLLQKGIPMNPDDKVKDKTLTGLELAIAYHYPSWENITLNFNEMVTYLIKKGATFKINNINFVLHDFVSKHHWIESDFLLFLDSSTYINSINENGKTPLHLEAQKANVLSCKEKFEILADYGSNINLQDEDGNTPLHLTVKSGNEKGVEILLNFEADHTILNLKRQTPLKILDGQRNRSSSYEKIDYGRIESIIHDDDYVSFFYDNRFSHFEKIACMIIRAIVRNEGTGKYMNEDVYFIRNELPLFYDVLKRELDQMMLKKVRVNISYYDILTKSVNVLERRLNKNNLESIQSSEVEKEFPFYGDMFLMRIRKIKERRILVEFCENYFKTLFHLEYEPPILVTAKMMSYLNAVDLITLWRIFKQPGGILSKFLNRSLATDLW